MPQNRDNSPERKALGKVITQVAEMVPVLVASIEHVEASAEVSLIGKMAYRDTVSCMINTLGKLIVQVHTPGLFYNEDGRAVLSESEVTRYKQL